MILVVSGFLNACQYILQTLIVIILDSGMRGSPWRDIKRDGESEITRLFTT